MTQAALAAGPAPRVGQREIAEPGRAGRAPRLTATPYTGPMIRRRVGNSFWLIAQDDHARLAGELARRFGNARFARPARFDSFVAGVALHDSGWPIHDDAPTLTDAGLPRDVFETTPEVAYEVWPASAERAAEADAHAGLLASLHAMSLAANATSGAAGQRDHETFDLASRRRQFLAVRFSHRVADLQKRLRQQLGLRTDRPTHLGLAHHWTDAREEALRRDFELLQALDKISLAICCTDVPSPVARPVRETVGGPDRPLKIARPTPGRLTVAPWPFDAPEMAVGVAYRAVPATPWPSPAALHEALAAAPAGELRVTVAAV